ncbi:MAG: hypothetical protein Q4B17_04880 [Lautropia sp.]|nr:hypothetical protein [Lautropia sp.]
MSIGLNSLKRPTWEDLTANPDETAPDGFSTTKTPGIVFLKSPAVTGPCSKRVIIGELCQYPQGGDAFSPDTENPARSRVFIRNDAR